MQILRVEHKIDNKGIFRSRTPQYNVRLHRMKGWKKLFERHRDNFPTPYLDKGINRSPIFGEFCAFKSVEQFQQWVTNDEIKGLIKIGFRVLLLEVSDCVVGKHQILFGRENVLTSKDISELF